MNFIITFKKERATRTPRSGRNLKPMICSIHRCMKQVRAIIQLRSIEPANFTYCSRMKHISPFILSETYLLPSSITSRNHVRRAPTHPCQPYLRRIRTKTFHIFPCLPASNKTRISPFYRIEIIKQSQIQTLTKYDMIFSFLCIDS